ncbi:MAG: hypothetical protein P4M09_11050 [Devosia sp.]|nr:hypothetical protein [Devosia sp.]
MTQPESIIVYVGRRTYVARRRVGHQDRYGVVAEILTVDGLAEAVARAVAEERRSHTPEPIPEATGKAKHKKKGGA